MWAAADTDGYARALLLEAARLLSIRCPRCARARLRRIAQHDVETTGADFMEASRQREMELEEIMCNSQDLPWQFQHYLAKW